MMNECPNSSLTAFETSSLFVERAISHIHASLHLLDRAYYPVIATLLLAVAKAEISTPVDYLGRRTIESVGRPL